METTKPNTACHISVNEGDVALTPLPQVDGRVKKRPTIAPRRLPGFGSSLACGVSRRSQRHLRRLPETNRPDDAGLSFVFKERAQEPSPAM
jgi:hypothetical protein